MSNVLLEDVCLARDSESDLAHRRWDHYPRKECQPPYHLYTLVLTLLICKRGLKCQESICVCVHMCIVAYGSLGAYKWPNDR